MSKFDESDRTRLIQLYHENYKLSSEAIRKFNYEKKIKRKSDGPTPKFVERLVAQFQETGSVERREYSKRSSLLNSNESLCNSVSETFNEIRASGDMPSIRKIVNDPNVSCSYTTVRNVLKDHLHMKPYKFMKSHKLPDHCFDLRTNFCNSLKAKGDSFLKTILFTDECHFYLNGFVNKQNMRFWGQEKPNTTIEVDPNCPKITTWCGISHDFFLEPYFFPLGQTVNGESYRHMIDTHVVPLLKNKRKLAKTVFMQDGASPHTAIATRELLEKHFKDRVLGRFFAFPWPSHSPDLNVCDFFLWGHLKDKVYTPGKDYNNFEQLRIQLEKEFSEISNETRKKSIMSLMDRADLCLQKNGHFFE